jgi:hypothetical protein
MGQVFNRGDVINEKTPLKLSFIECASYLTFPTHLHEKRGGNTVKKSSPQSNFHALSNHIRTEPQLSPASDSPFPSKASSSATAVASNNNSNSSNNGAGGGNSSSSSSSSGNGNRDYVMDGYCDENYVDGTDGYENTDHIIKSPFGLSFSTLKS